MACLALLLATGCGANTNGASGAGGGGSELRGGAGHAGVAAAGGNHTPGAGGGAQRPSAGANPETLNESQQQELARLKTELAAGQALDSSGILAKHALETLPNLSYDPRTSEFLDRIQASALALNDNELSVLGSNGFVISKRQGFPTFVRGYAAIYSEDLPVYISADAILEAVHSSYDSILSITEANALMGAVSEMLEGMHRRLPDLAAANSASAPDLDVFLSVARSLLGGAEIAPVAGGDAASIHRLYQLALAPSGQESLTLFGETRDFDASQFQPRGHYTNSTQFTAYFRAMMWLGRTDFRLIETNRDGSQTFQRQQYDAMLLLRQTMGDAELERFQKIEATLQAFVGESDSMIVPQIDALIADLGGLEAARAAKDDRVEAALRAGGYGIQRIASQIMTNDGVVATLPLARSFGLFGQRYVLDSHVFSQVVYDRLPSKRMMPNPLDVAFAALHNDQALPLLGSELAKFEGYPGALEGARILSDAHDATFWNGNLYNLWLSSLRALSPNTNLAQPAKSGMPQVTGTQAWGRRILSTQLGSWAELRHDTLLYAKQSYTGVPSCNYPDAYVDPYPEFFGKLRLFAERGLSLADLLEGSWTFQGGALRAYFTKLDNTLTTLEGMAKNQRAGTPFTEEQLAFVNRAVRIDALVDGCTTVDVPNGWLSDLYFDPMSSIKAAPTIADVHTQPGDEGGSIVGNVLHVAIGYPRLMITTVDTCQGPRAYAGVAFAYHEQVTSDFKRLNDQEWSTQLRGGAPPADVPWMAPVLAE